MFPAGLWQGRHTFLCMAEILLFYEGMLLADVTLFVPAFFALLLSGAALEDGRTGYISDGWSFLLASGGLSTSFHEGHLLWGAVAALLSFCIYGMLYFISRQSMGTGDILLASAASCWLTPLSCLLFIWFSALTASIFLGAGLVLEKWSLSEKVRFAPFMALGGILAYGWQEIWGTSSCSPWFPFG